MKHNKTRGTGKGMRKFIAVLITLVMITGMAHLAMIPSIALDTSGVTIWTVSLISGDNVNTMKVLDGTKIPLPVTPAPPEGMIVTGFLGWWSEESGDEDSGVIHYGLSDFPMTINKDITLYARFDNKYTVTYIDRGQVVYKQKITSGEMFPLLGAGSLSTPNIGDTFSAWKDKSSGDIITSGFPITSDITLEAYYTKNEVFVVTFISGVSPTTFRLVALGDTVEEPDEPEYGMPGFVRWSQIFNGSDAYNFSTPVTGDLVLYAVWSPPLSANDYPNEYIVNFYDSYGGAHVALQSVSIGGRATPVMYVKGVSYEGKGEFLGWYYKSDTIEFQFSFDILINDNYDLYAKWKTQPYTLTYDISPATETRPIDNNNYAYGNSVKLQGLEDYNHPTGQIFVGWKIGNTLYYPNNSFIITENTTAIAYYVPITTASDLITITYVANRDGAEPDASLVESFKCNKDTELFLYGSDAYTCDGYILVGLNTKADCSGTSYGFSGAVKATEDITFYGVWNEDDNTNETTYTVTYAPGDHGTFAAVPHKQLTLGQDTPAAPTSTPGEPGWKFTGWKPTVAATVTGDMTYIAQWEQYYTVTYAPGDHGTFTAVPHSQLTLGQDTPAAPTSTPGEPGWKFTGWTPAVTPTVTGDMTYTAQWEQFYTVIYAPGTHGTFTQVTHSPLTPGQDTPAAPAATGESGWVFAGWSPSRSLTVTGNATYVAQWSLYEPPPDNNPPETDPPETDPPETDPPETDPPETDPPETDPPETDPPVNPQPPEPPYIPGGTDFFVPPIPMESSSTIVETEDGGWLELDENGTPLGKWEWDGTEWVFEEYEPPLSDMPMTNIQSLAGFYIVMLIMLTSCSIRVIAQIKQRKSHSKF